MDVENTGCGSQKHDCRCGGLWPLVAALKDTHRHIETIERINADARASLADGTHEAKARAKMLIERLIELSANNCVGSLSAGIRAVRGLMNESVGVAGLHRNGDVATWAELEEGGRFGEWLAEFNEAERLIDLSAPTATEDAGCNTTSKTRPSA